MFAREVGSTKAASFQGATLRLSSIANRGMVWQFSLASLVTLVLSTLFASTLFAAAQPNPQWGTENNPAFGAPQASRTCTVIATPSLRLRGGPGVRYATLASLPRDTKLYAIGRNADSSWIEVIESLEDTSGWVSAGSDLVRCTISIAALPVTSVVEPVNPPANSVDVPAPAPPATPVAPGRAVDAVIAVPPAISPPIVAEPARAAQSQPLQYVGLPADSVASLPQRNLPEIPASGFLPLTQIYSEAEIRAIQRAATTYSVLSNDGFSTSALDESRLGVFSESINFAVQFSEYTSYTPYAVEFRVYRTDEPGGEFDDALSIGAETGQRGIYCAFFRTVSDDCASASLSAGAGWPTTGYAIANGYYALKVILSFANGESDIQLTDVYYFAIASPELQPSAFVTEINGRLPASSQIVLPRAATQPSTLQPSTVQPRTVQPAAVQPVTAAGSYYFRGSATVSCVSDGRVRFEGNVTHNGQPVNGVSIGFKSRLVEGTTPVVRPETSGPSGLRPNWPNGYFESIVDGDASTAKDKHLEIWVLNSAGERISDYVNWDTDGSTGTCNTATVNFTSP